MQRLQNLNFKKSMNDSDKNKKSKKFVAVLLAAYNGEPFLEEQINTILAQEDIDLELFISIDISTDKTYEKCKIFEKKNKKVTVLPYGETFGNAAKNFFRLIKDVDFDNFDYVAFSDQDDVWDKKKLFHATDQMQKKNIDGFSSDVVAFWENGKEKYIKKSWPQKKFDYHFESAGPGCTYVLKTNALNKFKNYLINNWNLVNTVKFHDWIIYAFFRNSNYHWKIDSLPMVRYRQHSVNEFGANSDLKSYKKRVILIWSKWYKNEVNKIKSILDSNNSLNLTFRIKNFLELRRRPRDTIILLLLSILGLY